MSAIPLWTHVFCPPDPIDGGEELQWLDDALGGISTAALWSSPRGLVAPSAYRHYRNFDAACALSAARGWPVRLRRSGGGVVPQGPGILNLSLAYPYPGEMDAVYEDLCSVLSEALGDFGIATTVSTVQGSFCDGRFNLAVVGSHNTTPRKIAGTAQYWRHSAGKHAVLGHALLIVDADPNVITDGCNRFEANIGGGRRYDASALTSVANAWNAAHPRAEVPPDLMAQMTHRLGKQLSLAAKEETQFTANVPNRRSSYGGKNEGIHVSQHVAGPQRNIVDQAAMIATRRD